MTWLDEMPTRIDVDPAVIGYHVNVSHRGMTLQPGSWALTRWGACRKARRMLRRMLRTEPNPDRFDNDDSPPSPRVIYNAA